MTDGGLLPSWCTRNVFLNIAYCALTAAGSSLSAGFAFSNFLVSLPNQSDETVGTVAAVGGVCMVILALPVGFLTDRLPRSVMLRTSAVIGLASACVFGAALWTRKTHFFYAASALSGIYQAVSGPALAASFADALPTGGRTAALTVQQAVSLIAAVLGPAIAAFLLQNAGNAWNNIDVLIMVMTVGNVLAALACGLLPLIRDDGALGAAAEGALGGGGGPLVADGLGMGLGLPVGLNSGTGADVGADGRDDETDLATLRAVLLLSGEGDDDEKEEEEDNARSNSTPNVSSSAAELAGLGSQVVNLPVGYRLTVASIPYLIFISDILIACGAGMTVAFFPLYFSQELSLPPVAVACIFAIAPLLIALASLASLPVSRLIGRARASLALDVVGTVGTLLLAVLRLDRGVAVGIYLARTAAMNSSYPIQRAILMDVVASADRGKWSSLENLTSFTWTGSAALGGWLVEKHGFGFSFLITAVIYMAGCVPLCLVVPLTHGETVDVLAQAKDKDKSVMDAKTAGTSASASAG